MTTPANGRNLANDARALAAVRRGTRPEDPVIDALEMLATVIDELADDVETLTRELTSGLHS